MADQNARPNRRKQLGDHGERLAAAWYRRRGYSVLAQNWRCRNGELDLVLGRRGELIFCEVKTRSSRAFGHPIEAVTATKQRRIRQLALQWMAYTDTYSSRLRFDVAAVEHSHVDVWRDAF